MKAPIILFLLFQVLPSDGLGQGVFIFAHPTAPTRLWSADGPSAGPGIWAQMLAGPDADSLTPVGVPVEHRVGGWAAAGWVVVPTVPPRRFASVQMVVWDGRIWGTSFAGVPESQLGRTDVVRLTLSDGFFVPIGVPLFQQSAIVPIPEPSVWVLGMAGCGLLVVAFRFRRGLN